jgi:hypothetical protein
VVSKFAFKSNSHRYGAAGASFAGVDAAALAGCDAVLVCGAPLAVRGGDTG